MRKVSQVVAGGISAALLSGASCTTYGFVINPVYFSTFGDAVTGDNAYLHQGSRFWNVDAGADLYQGDIYERPTVQSYGTHGSLYSANEYFEYLDIVQARVGLDNQYMYVSIDMFGRDKSTSDGVDTAVGLVERYGFRFGFNPDGRDGYFMYADQPENQIGPPNTVFGSHATYGYRDTDSDVGGRGLINGHAPTGLWVTKQDNPWEEVGMNGFDDNFISDGMIGGQSALFARIDPTDNTVVELALDYTALGLTMAQMLQIQYLDFEALKGDPADPQNYLWNDKYNWLEAGSPNPGSNGLSEFGTQGLGNIYELDTLRGGLIPAPGALGLLGLAALARRSRRRLS